MAMRIRLLLEELMKEEEEVSLEEMEWVDSKVETTETAKVEEPIQQVRQEITPLKLLHAQQSQKHRHRNT
jgi:hypothetical protein